MNRAHLGRAWEDALDAQHEVYRAQRLADVERLQAPYQVLRVRGRGFFDGQFRGKGRSDYIASVPGLGTVYVEAKSTHAARWPFDSLDEEQARFLDARPHAIRVLVIRWEFIGEPWRSVVVPWVAIRELWWTWHHAGSTRVQASITVEDAVRMGVEIRGADWLRGVR